MTANVFLEATRLFIVPQNISTISIVDFYI